MDRIKKRGPRIIGAIIITLILLFFTIEVLLREAQHFSPTSVTNILLFSLQLIVFLLVIILLFVMGRPLTKLYLERRRRVVGSHFKTKLLLFFIALSMIPTLLLFLFASDLISDNIENLFKTPIETILDDTQNLSDGYYVNAREITGHYAEVIIETIKSEDLGNPDMRRQLEKFAVDKLKEYQLDEIGVYLDDEEVFAALNSNLPLQYYQDVRRNMIMRAHLGEEYSDLLTMGNGELVRRGLSVEIPSGNLMVVTGKFLPQNYSQRINNIKNYVQRYRQQKLMKGDVRTVYLITLIFVTLLIIFAAIWIAFHLAKGITVPIEKLAQATREVSKGNLSVRVEDPASDELGILIDSFNQMIADLKESQENIAQKALELESRKQYIETVLNNVSTGVITLNAKGHITTINPSAHSMLALQESDLIGMDYRDVFVLSAYEKIAKCIQNGLHQKFNPGTEEIDLYVSGQTSSLAMTVSPLSEDETEYSGMILVFDDLTQLIKAQKIAAWKEVAQRVAHEIKNPLTPIQLSAERIMKNLKQKGRKDNAVIAEGAQTIVQEARTIKALVDEFSNFARLPSISLQSASIHEIIELTIFLFKDIFADINIKTDLSSEVPDTIQLDPEQMKRVFINLFDNAIDAMNKKGEITLKTSFDRIHKMVKIEISDSGPGISLEDKHKLFLPHFSTKKKGTGLGLAIVNQVISEHNGTIEVENIQPQGAKFIIQVPA
ncbi:ATP-binding protein [Acidobacteriota bacterium]